MPTKSSSRAETRTTSIDAPPEAVLDLVADPHNLPRWAPGVARAVRPDGDDWLVDNGEGETRITVRVSREHGTVDLLAAADPRLGAFTRVLPNGDGSEYQFTLFFPGDVPEDAVARQMAIVQDELRTVRTLCEPA
ncbi:SRPBCC family protein [Amycolatopsis nigrescens]|uniref:SRPBCC family protein n=1 Tax=Amycolatopsis nigrescens TaxID=381445 RepID=UPI00047787E5|nr:SRPBCC family protein [Amycolatopsis nigrescens]